MTKATLKKLAKDLVSSVLGVNVPTSNISLLEFGANGDKTEYLLFKFTTSKVHYAYHNNILGKSLVVFADEKCENGLELNAE